MQMTERHVEAVERARKRRAEEVGPTCGCNQCDWARDDAARLAEVAEYLRAQLAKGITTNDTPAPPLAATSEEG